MNRPCKYKSAPAGQRFGLWTVLAYSHVVTRLNGNKCHFWHCRCDCGTESAVNADQVAKGRSGSCGCRQHEISRKLFTKHGLAGTPEHQTWVRMKQRCSNSNDKRYADWGGRGIKVCERWLNSFENFLADMGKKPSARHSIERINNDGNYEPGNCKWATSTEQNRNKRNQVTLTLNGETLILTDWARRLGIDKSLLQTRIKRGWSDADALTLPPWGKQVVICARGHRFTPENTYITARGFKRCRSCTNLRARERRQESRLSEAG